MNMSRIEEKAGELRLLGLIVSQQGKTLYSHTWDSPCRRIVFSVSKSFTSCAVGFAVQEGRLRLDERLVDLFPDELPAQPDENLCSATIRDALTMCLGQEKGLLMGGQRVDIEADDWAREALKTPFVHKPGTHFVYSNVGPYLAGLAVQKRVGCNLVDYLMPRLFQPLGIKLPTWEVDPLGRTFGASGLMLALPELHKLGLLYQRNGCWNGQQLLSPEWIRESSRKQVENGEEGYGYLFWRGKYNSFRADGMYGQYSIVIPDKEAVITTTAENRNQKEMLEFLLDEIVPQL
ncbi:MAG: serine hydrolase [bacterium]|nr:serine hydrolase [bacterium]